MYEELGWWFPDTEDHFPVMLKKNISKGGPAEYQQPVRLEIWSRSLARSLHLNQWRCLETAWKRMLPGPTSLSAHWPWATTTPRHA